MKKALFFSLALSLLIGCSQQVEENPVNASLSNVASSAEENLSDIGRYYLNEELTDSFPLTDTSLNYLFISEFSGSQEIRAVHAFSSESALLSFTDSKGIPLRDQVTKATMCREYAESIGAIEHYDQTGEIMEEYLNYEKEVTGINKTSIGAQYITHWRGYTATSGPTLTQGNMPGLPVHFYGWCSVLGIYPGWNNSISGFRMHPVLGAGCGVTYYDKTFYRQGISAHWVWYGSSLGAAAFIGDLAYANDKASSVAFY